MVAIDYELCDVFARGPFTGNPLAVFDVKSDLPERQLQLLAREINYSEVCFLSLGERGNDGRLRIFTRTQELRFAGHPVLGAAFILAVSTATHTVALETRMGPVEVTFSRISKNSGFGWLKQPVPQHREYDFDDELLRALGITPMATPLECYWNGALHAMVSLESEEEVRALQPDMRALVKLPPVCVSCFALSRNA